MNPRGAGFSSFLPDRWLRSDHRRKLKITRSGWAYLGFTLVIGMAALNTGNNLLFLLLGLLLAGIILSGILSESSIRQLSVERILPLEPQVGVACLVGIRVSNRKPRQSSFAIIARDMTDSGETGRAFALTISPDSHRDLAYRWEPAKRGELKFTRIELGTRFPFGIFEKWRMFEMNAETVVFPREVAPPSILPRRVAPFGETASRSIGPGTEFFALRDIRVGDDARSIHWATSARRGRPVVVEREREHRRRVAVLVDNRPGTFGQEDNPKAIESQLDRLAEGAAALIRKALDDGCEVALSTSETSAPAGFGSAHQRRLMRILALMGASAEQAPPIAAAGADIVELRSEQFATEPVAKPGSAA
jgi:uncharacterized protein (DUF58 family)